MMHAVSQLYVVSYIQYVWILPKRRMEAIQERCCVLQMQYLLRVDIWVCVCVCVHLWVSGSDRAWCCICQCACDLRHCFVVFLVYIYIQRSSYDDDKAAGWCMQSPGVVLHSPRNYSQLSTPNKQTYWNSHTHFLTTCFGHKCISLNKHTIMLGRS